MTAVLAIGTAMLMTAVGVAISGLVIELLLFALSRGLQPQARPHVEQTGSPSVIHLKPSDKGAIEWAEEVAA